MLTSALVVFCVFINLNQLNCLYLVKVSPVCCICQHKINPMNLCILSCKHNVSRSCILGVFPYHPLTQSWVGPVCNSASKCFKISWNNLLNRAKALKVREACPTCCLISHPKCCSTFHRWAIRASTCQPNATSFNIYYFNSLFGILIAAMNRWIPVLV